jgi:cytochrome c oxidase subunit II
MFWGSVAITVFMIALGFYAIRQNQKSRRKVPARLLILGGGVIFPLTVVTGLLIYGVVRAPALWSGLDTSEAYRVEVIGHRWWWEIRYPDAAGGALHDANELHIPAGRPVIVHVSTNDVIHSFWVPRLAGKIDAIPGIVNRLRIEAGAAGVYRGVCAEFCGAQHARMGFLVEAHDEDALNARLARLAASTRGEPAAPDSGGARAFEAHCAACHSLDARTRPQIAGPNLAALGSRRSLGGGILANEEGTIRRWMLEHQRLKPGNLMPPMDHLPKETLDAIIGYLERRP